MTALCLTFPPDAPYKLHLPPGSRWAVVWGTPEPVGSAGSVPGGLSRLVWEVLGWPRGAAAVPSGTGRSRLSRWHLPESGRSGSGIKRETFSAGGNFSSSDLPTSKTQTGGFTPCCEHFTSRSISEPLLGLTATLPVPIFHSSFFYPVPPHWQMWLWDCKEVMGCVVRCWGAWWGDAGTHDELLGLPGSTG